MIDSYDLIVIGGGTAGLRAATTAAREGLHTALFEPGTLGGTCLNTGCIPTKAMLHAAHLYTATKNLQDFGIKVSDVKVNFSKLMRRVRELVSEGQDHIKKSLHRQNLTVIRKKAHFVGKNKIYAGGKIYTGKKFIVATGAKTFIPPIKGLNKVNYLTNETAINLNKFPKDIVMIGGGYISMEFATFFSELGAKVTVLELGPCILSMLDADVLQSLNEIYDIERVNIKTNTCVSQVKQEKGKIAITITDTNGTQEETIKTQALFIGTGRIPNTQGLDLEAASIKVGRRKEILVNEYLQTSNPNVFAIGDVNGKAMFAHAAKRETKIVLENVIFNHKQKMNFDLVPWAVFTHPPVAGVGLSEKEARKNKSVKVLKAPFTKAGRAAIMKNTKGFVKLMYHAKTKKILGVVIIGTRADDIIHEFVAIMNSSSPTITTLRKMIHIHPTVSEVMEVLK